MAIATAERPNKVDQNLEFGTFEACKNCMMITMMMMTTMMMMVFAKSTLTALRWTFVRSHGTPGYSWGLCGLRNYVVLFKYRVA